jgi:hypothetical protein
VAGREESLKRETREEGQLFTRYDILLYRESKYHKVNALAHRLLLGCLCLVDSLTKTATQEYL